QPQLNRASSGRKAVKGMKTAVASRVPAWVPCRVQLVVQARLASAACSRETEIALACSPEAESPWTMRQSTRRIGARMPTWRSEEHSSELQSRFELLCRCL